MNQRSRIPYLTRRDFLIRAGVISGGLAVTRLLPGGADGEFGRMSRWPLCGSPTPATRALP